MHSISRLVVLLVVSLGFSTFAEEDAPSPVSIAIGDEKAVVVNPLQKAVIDDPSLATLRIENKNFVWLKGKKAGRTLVRLWRKGETDPSLFDLTVTETPEAPVGPAVRPARRTGRALVNTDESFKVGETLVRPLVGIAQVAIGDPKVADVGTDAEGLWVVGMSPGATTLLIWLKDGSRQEFHLTVR